MRIVEALHAAHPDGDLRRHDQGRAPAAASRPAAAAARHRLPVRDERRRVARRSRAGAARKGHTRQDFLEAVALCRAGGPDARADVRGLPPVADARGLLRSARHHRAAGSRRSRRADSAGDPAARPAGVAAARDSRRCDACALSFDPATLAYRWVASRSAGRRAARGGVDPRRRRASPRIDARSSTRSARWRTTRPGSPRPAVPARAGAAPRASVPYLNEPWYCCAEPNPEQLSPSD